MIHCDACNKRIRGKYQTRTFKVDMHVCMDCEKETNENVKRAHEEGRVSDALRPLLKLEPPVVTVEPPVCNLYPAGSEIDHYSVGIIPLKAENEKLQAELDDCFGTSAKVVLDERDAYRLEAEQLRYELDKIVEIAKESQWEARALSDVDRPNFIKEVFCLGREKYDEQAKDHEQLLAEHTQCCEMLAQLKAENEGLKAQLCVTGYAIDAWKENDGNLGEYMKSEFGMEVDARGVVECTIEAIKEALLEVYKERWALRAQISKARAENETLKREVSDLKGIIETGKAENKELYYQRNGYRIDSEKLREELERTGELKAENEGLKEDVEGVGSTARFLNSALDKKEAELDEMKLAAQATEKERDELKAEWHEEQEKAQKFEVMHQELRKKARNLVSQIEMSKYVEEEGHELKMNCSYGSLREAVGWAEK